MLKLLSFSTDVTWAVWIWLNKWSHYYAAHECERDIIQMVTVISVIICILAQNSIVGIDCFGTLSLSISHNAHILGQCVMRRPSFVAILSQCAFNYLWKWLEHCPLVIRINKSRCKQGLRWSYLTAGYVLALYWKTHIQVWMHYSVYMKYTFTEVKIWTSYALNWNFQKVSSTIINHKVSVNFIFILWWRTQ